MSAERDETLLQDIVEHAEEAIEFLEGVSPTRFRKDRQLCLAVERLLEIVGEAANGLSEDARRRVSYDWRGVRGLRNVIAHQYGAVDPDQLHAVVKRRLPELVAAIRRAKDE